MVDSLKVNFGKVQGQLQKIPPLHPQKHRWYFQGFAALCAALFMYFATNLLPYYPSGWRILLILAVGGIWFLRPLGGMLVTLLVLILPIAFAFPYGGGSLALTILTVLLLMVLVNPYSFLFFALITLAFAVPSFLWLLLLAPLVLGYLGESRGAFAAALGCFWIELLMLVSGRASVGLVTGGTASAPLIIPHRVGVSSLQDFSWVAKPPHTALHGSDFLAKVFTPFIERPILLGQIALWAIAAAAVAVLLRRPLTRAIPLRMQAALGGMLLLGVGEGVLAVILAQGSDISNDIIATVIPAFIIMLFSPLFEVGAYVLAPTDNAPAWPGAARAKSTIGQTDALENTVRDIPTDTWGELAGVDGIQQELAAAIKSLFDPATREGMQRMGLKPTRGILLFGPPGTGKTKLARIIAHEANAAFFAVSGTEFTSKWVGESEANLRRIFEKARKSRPSVLFFDEIEAFLPRRAELSRSDAPEKGVIATFLAYTDGVGELDGVLLVAATNYPNLIEPAALRPGRFDKLIYVSAPDRNARYQIFERYLNGKPLAEDVDINKLADRSERFTGADIQSVCVDAAKRAFERGKGKPEPITMADLETVLGGMKASVTIKMVQEYEEIADQYGRRSQRPDAIAVIARPDLHWSDVAGIEDVKEALHEAIEMPLKHPEIFAQYGIKPSKGVLLFGPPGCGKTFLAKVVASEAQAHFIDVKGPELLQQFVGGSEARLHDIFIRARENSPCVLFFDEIDAIAGARGSVEGNNTQLVAQFLTEMDGFQELKGVIVVAATNRPDVLDPALLRPGRLDRILYVPPPDHPARLALLQKELGGKPLAEDINYEVLADETEGYSSADIAGICNAAARAAVRETLRSGVTQVITNDGLLEQLRRTPRSISPEQIAIYEALRAEMER